MELKRRTEKIAANLLQNFNCTLWNWNVITQTRNPVPLLILIVPYGIETRICNSIPAHYIRILIVLYGIETVQVLPGQRFFRILIVPYGIETN